MRVNDRGFSLVELSIVLVIIGLLIGGVMAGKSLIHNSKLRGVSGSFLTYEAAIHNFRDQYNYLPGDMPTASKYWSTAINGPAAGHLGTYLSATPAWQHLGLAGLIAGSYPGTQANPGAGACVGDTECPSASVNGLVFLTVWNGTGSTTPPYGTSGKSGVILYDGTNIDGGAGLSPNDAASLDIKLDDGAPGTGKLYGIGYGGFGNGDGYDNCSVDAVGSAYNVSNKTSVCRPFYIVQ